MAREIGKLTALGIQKAKKPGFYADGGGLYLRIGPSGGKSWIYRFMRAGKRHDMGLGPVHSVSLVEARAKATECRKQRLEGLDPLATQKSLRLAAKLEAAKAMTFRECAAAYIEAHAPSWRNPKHADQWRNTLETYAGPVIGDLPVQAVDLPLVLKVLEPIWTGKTETASRLRGRIESVLDWATVRGFRQGENPARWRGHLDSLLPRRSKVQKVVHHAALPYAEIGVFVHALQAQDGTAARALEFLILTGCRTGEVIGARWAEIDLASGIWTVPDVRMKAGREHRVPLSPAALRILERMRGQDQEFVFPGGRVGRPLSNMAMLKVLERMQRDDLTAHGFRSTFRDWAAEQTHFPREVAEAALAHTLSDKVEAAYRRGDLFQKRRELMDAWAAYVFVNNN